MDSTKPVTSPKKLTLRLAEDGRIQLVTRDGEKVFHLEGPTSTSSIAKKNNIDLLINNNMEPITDVRIFSRTGDTRKLAFQYLGVEYGLKVKLFPDGRIKELDLKESTGFDKELIGGKYQRLASFEKKHNGMTFLDIEEAAYNDLRPEKRFAPAWQGKTLQIIDNHSGDVYAFDLSGSQPKQHTPAVTSSTGSALQIERWEWGNKEGKVIFRADDHRYLARIDINGSEAAAGVGCLTQGREGRKSNWRDNFWGTVRYSRTTAFSSAAQVQENKMAPALVESMAATVSPSEKTVTVPSPAASVNLPLTPLVIKNVA